VLDTALLLELGYFCDMPVGGSFGELSRVEVGVAVAEALRERLRVVEGLYLAGGMAACQWDHGEKPEEGVDQIHGEVCVEVEWLLMGC
jgi:hypothetical protein